MWFLAIISSALLHPNESRDVSQKFEDANFRLGLCFRDGGGSGAGEGGPADGGGEGHRHCFLFGLQLVAGWPPTHPDPQRPPMGQQHTAPLKKKPDTFFSEIVCGCSKFDNFLGDFIPVFNNFLCES